MKIPETPANVGAYYGNDENGQWQPNGVIVEGVVGGGDAPAHPPVYPVHVARHHVAGYVMAGAYYPPAPYAPVPQQPPPDDFEDYMWMENEEEFDKQVMQQLEEEALMEQCIEAMLEDEQRERTQRPPNSHNTNSSDSSLSLAETVSRSTLNPLAKEFVPTMRPKITHEKAEPPSPAATTEPQPANREASQPTEATSNTEVVPEVTADVTTEDSLDEDTSSSSPVPTNETPEVSAADVVPITQADKRPKDIKDTKTKPKAEPKKVKSEPKVTPKDVKTKAASKPTLPVKSETKVQAPKKKEVKSVKSEVRVEDKVEDLVQAVEATKLSSPAPPTPVTEEPQTGFKPINYAAAAKANKPKKPSMEKTPPPVEKPSAVKVPADKTAEKKDKLPAPKTARTDKIIPRKNSAK